MQEQFEAGKYARALPKIQGQVREVGVGMIDECLIAHLTRDRLPLSHQDQMH